MPTIPIFDAGNNQSAGSIAPATTGLATSTANLFLNEGRALAEKIEVQSSKAEAQMKAPIIATAYADGLSKISQGDFSGFGRMEAANAMTAGNPFLMKFAEGARGEATQIARNFLDNELSNRRIQAEKDLQDKRITAQKDIQTGVERRQGIGAMIHENAQIDAANRKQQSDYVKAHDIWARNKQLGINEPEPVEPTPFEKRTGADFGITDIPLPAEGGVSGNGNDLTNSNTSSELNIPTPETGSERVPKNSMNEQPVPEPKRVFTIAGVPFTAPIVQSNGVKIKSVKGLNGTTYELNDPKDVVGKIQLDAYNKAIQLSGEAEAADPAFTKWYVEKLRDKYTVQIDKSNKDKVTASATSTDPNTPKELQKTYYTTDLVIPANADAKTPEIRRPAGAPDAQAIPISGDLVSGGDKSILNQLGGAFKTAGIQVAQKQEQAPQEMNLSEEGKQKILTGLNARASENPAGLEYFKQQAEKAGLDPELIKVTPRVDRKVVQANEADKVLQDQGVNVDKIKQEEEKQKARETFDKKKNLAEKTLENSSSAIKDLKFRISLLEKDLEQMKKEKAPLSDLRFKASEIKRHQDQITEEENRIKESKKFLTGV